MSSDSSAARAERGGDATRLRIATPGIPARIGRFRVEHVLGRGGLGVVYAGRDPELERSVALKLVRADARVCREDSRARLVREARALARLDHPNVVRVFDVGWVDEHDPSSAVFIAMELVDGCTLREWLRAEPHTWREIVARFVLAGRGLAAVHANGFVHRDFKPSNVLVSADDRVLLADFGLVHGSSSPPEDTLAAAISSSWSGSSDAHDDPLTRIGTVIGTPHYMAPEQRAGRRVIPASDQYSFCVALGDALFGGSAPGATDARRVPRRLRRAVQRGRSHAPSDRFGSMESLLAELETVLQPGAGSTVGWALAGAFACVGASVLALSLPAGTGCEDRDARRDALWGPERRAEIEAALAPTLPASGDTWARVSAVLDAKANAWSDALESACEAQRDPALAEIAAAQQACLEDVHARLEAVVQGLEQAHAQTWVSALSAARAIDPAEQCLADDAASREPPLRELVHLRTAIDLGHHQEALAEARRLEIAYPDDPRITANAAVVLGRIALDDASFDEAASQFARAYWLASESDEPWARKLGAQAAIAMLHMSWLRGRFDDAHTWTRHAEVAVARANDDALADQLGLEIAGFERHLGDHEAAEARVESLLDRMASRPDGQGQYLRALGLHVELLAARGAYEAALRQAELALSVARDTFGDAHPITSTAHYHVAMAHDYAGRKEQTLAELRESLRIEKAAFGPEHVRVARAEAMLGNTLQGMGRPHEARAALEHALEVTERIHGPHHRETGEMLGMLSTNAVARGDLEAADTMSARELEILARWLPPHTDQVVIAQGARAELLMLRGRLPEAEALAEDAIVGARAIAGEYGSLEIETLNVVLRIRLQQGRAEETLAEATRALAAIRQRGETATRDAALMLWFQGRAHLQLGADKDAAAALLAATAAIDDGGIDQPELAAPIQVDLATALAKTGQTKSARKAAELAIASYRTMTEQDGLANAERVLASLP